MNVKIYLQSTSSVMANRVNKRGREKHENLNSENENSFLDETKSTSHNSTETICLSNMEKQQT